MGEKKKKNQKQCSKKENEEGKRKFTHRKISGSFGRWGDAREIEGQAIRKRAQG